MSSSEAFQLARRFSQAGLLTKRGLDIVGAAMALVVLSPLMVLIAVLIRIESPGPILFRQSRYGRDRVPFRIYKFRTMRHEGEAEFRQAVRGDSRITRSGQVLRRFNLDELPQLLNVLLGHMSLVGPRPHPVELDDRFSPLIDNYSRRHTIRPGITGWSQVNGYRGETDTIAKMQGRIQHDLYYIDNWSLWLDLRILLQTLISATAYRNAF